MIPMKEIIKIDGLVNELIKIRDKPNLSDKPIVKGLICEVISKCYQIEWAILSVKKIKEDSDHQFFVARESIVRYFYDWGLDEVAEIYLQLRELVKKHNLFDGHLEG